LLVAIVNEIPSHDGKITVPGDLRAINAGTARAIWRSPASAITAARRRGNSQSGNWNAATGFPKFEVTDPCMDAKLKDFTREFWKTPLRSKPRSDT
jgi:hypothetical protein